MKPLLHHLSRAWPLLVWIAVGLILFVPVLGYYQALPSPDSPPFFPAGYRLRAIEQILAGLVVLSPHDLFNLLLPPLVHNDLIYLVDTLLIAAGCAYLLRGRGLPPVAAWIGGGILAFAGYSFTLISAGHMGYFHMTVYVMFMLGFLARAVDQGRWFHFALAGIFGAWILKFGPDLGLLYLMLAMLYGLWLVLRNTAGTPGSVRLRRLGVGVPVAAFCFLLGANSSIRTILTVHLKNRQAQIAGTVAQPTQPGTATAAAAPTDPQAQWIFATNWSLPPAEIVEFVAPCLFGTQSGDPRAPYWGKLGRTLGWEQHRQGFPNFRQHAVYLGGLQLMLAAFAVGCWWQGRKRVQGSGFRVAGLSVERCALNVERSGSQTGVPESPWLADVPFWAGVWVIGLLLALGRHAPLYRLFYSLPYMSLLRAPVKFVRFVELATAILAATGVAALLIVPVADRRRRLRGWVIAAGACASLCVLAALWANGSGMQIRAALEPLGLSPLGGALQGNMIRALIHAAIAFAVAAAVFLLRGRLHGSAALIPLLIVVWIALDALLVNRRFIMAWDLSACYRQNRIVKRVLDEGGASPVVASYATPHVQQDWFSHSFTANGIYNCVPSPQAPEGNAFRQLHASLQHDPRTFWELSGGRFVVLPLTAARSLAGPRLTPVSTLQLVNGDVVDARDESRTFVLAQVPRSLPYAWLTPSWSIVPEDQSLQATATRAGRQRTIATGEGEGEYGRADQPPGKVEVLSVRYRGKALKTVLRVDTPAEQFLTVRMPAQSNPEIVATLDGRAAAVRRANHVWVGIPVPAGRHQIEFHAMRNWPAVCVNGLPVLMFMGLLATYRSGKRKTV